MQRIHRPSPRARALAAWIVLATPQAYAGIRRTLPGDAPSFRVEPIRVSAGSPFAMGVLDRVLVRTRPLLRPCFDAERRQHPGFVGSLTVRVDVSETGAVSATQTTRPTAANPAVHTCVERVLSSVRFPAPPGGSVTVTFSMHYGTPTGGL